jgi:hypothetical protein
MEDAMTVEGRIICEVCQQSIEPGEAVVLAQESDGVVMVGFLDTTADGRIATFHEAHWPERVGNWQERERGHAR